MKDLKTKKEIELIGIDDVKNIILLSQSSIYRLIGDGKLPRPIKISENRAVWIKSEIIDYRNRRIAMRDQAVMEVSNV